MPLTPEDRRHLTAAVGYVELGMPLDANEELENINSEARHVPEVLMVRLEIYSTFERWDLMQVVASNLAKRDPDNPQWAISWAYATRRADSIDTAKLILEHALERHPQVALLHFNLACYECQLGNLEKAKQRLERAFKLAPSCRLEALHDEDLKPLWDSNSLER